MSAETEKDQIIKAYEEYIIFLGKEYESVHSIAYIHHYRVTNEVILKGIALRDRIRELVPEAKFHGSGVVQQEQDISTRKYAPIINEEKGFEKVELRSRDPKIFGTPHCKTHGAMNKISVFEDGGGFWRCMSAHGRQKIVNGNSISYKEIDRTCEAACIETRL